MRSTRISVNWWRWELSSAPASALLVAALAVGTPGPAQADGRSVVAWRDIVGILEPGGLVGWRSGGVECEVNVDCAQGTPAPWIVTSGNAAADLTSGALRFTVRGLVVAGDPSFSNIGTTTVVTHVKGTLVCNDTAPGPAELADTEAVRLNALGDARFSGQIDLPASCMNEPEDIVFLIRIAEVSDPGVGFLVDLWNAAGVYRALRQPQF